MFTQNIINYIFAFVLFIVMIKVFSPNYESFDSLVISNDTGDLQKLTNTIGKDISIQFKDVTANTMNVLADVKANTMNVLADVKANKMTSNQICIGDTWCDDTEWGHPVYLGMARSYMVLDIDNDKAVMANRRDKTIQYQIKYLQSTSINSFVLHQQFPYNRWGTTTFHIRRVSDGKYLTSGGASAAKVTHSDTPFAWTYEYDQLVDPLTKLSIHHQRINDISTNYTPRIVMYTQDVTTPGSSTFFMPVF